MLKAGFGGLAGQLVNLIAMPVLSRLYDPDDVAAWIVMMASVQVVGALASLRYELAVVLPERDEDAQAVAWLSFLVGTLIAGLMAALLFVPAVRELVAPADSGLGPLVWLAPTMALALGVNNVLASWCVRRQCFGIQSWSLVALAVVTTGVQITLAVFWRPDGAALILGSFAGVGAAILVASLAGFPGLPRRERGRVAALREVASRYRRFPLFSTPYAVFGLLRDRVSILLLGAYFSRADVGLYGWASRVMNFPVTLAGGAIRPVVFREASAHGVARVERPVLGILNALAIMATPFVVLFVAYADELFAFAFGAEWRAAGPIGLVLVWPAFFFMFSGWMDRLLDVMGLQHVSFVMEGVFGSASLAALWIGCSAGLALRDALYGSAAVLVVYNVVYVYVTFRRAGFGMRPLLMRLGLVVGVGAACAALLAILNALLAFRAAVPIYTVLVLAGLALAARPLFRMVQGQGA
jgi:O-antigen/teichoic acid export membrane protein